MAAPLLNNRYRPTIPLGKGGFGVTVIAEDTHMPSRRACVIKQLNPTTTDPSFICFAQERFHREAATLEELGNGHDQIPKLYAYFEEGGRFYLVQELIQGQTLTKAIKANGPLKENLVIELLASILAVLSYVHSKGIIHRDLKPDNIILRQADHKPVLIDFGAVKETMLTHEVNVAGNTKVIGTPGYMPIEQGLGRPVFSSDLYSLGMVTLFLLTGQGPSSFRHDPLTGSLIWRDQAGISSSTLAKVIDKGIQLHPRDRYATARDMLADMADLQVDLLADEMRRFRRRSEGGSNF